MTEKSQHLFLSARMKGDNFGFDEGPDAFVIPVFTETQEARIRKLTQLCKDEELSEVREYRKGTWVKVSGEEVRTDLDELVVTSTGFWFTCCLKNTDVAYETPALTFEEVLSEVEQSGSNTLIPVDAESKNTLTNLFDEDAVEQLFEALD